MISSSYRRGEKERRKEPPSLRYLATEILFKGYCIIFLMRFSSFPLSYVSSIYINNLFSSWLSQEVFPFKYNLERGLAKLCRLLQFFAPL